MASGRNAHLLQDRAIPCSRQLPLPATLPSFFRLAATASAVAGHVAPEGFVGYLGHLRRFAVRTIQAGKAQGLSPRSAPIRWAQAKPLNATALRPWPGKQESPTQ
jgi:hypothetical protein